jgi:hypothetical protein
VRWLYPSRRLLGHVVFPYELWINWCFGSVTGPGVIDNGSPSRGRDEEYSIDVQSFRQSLLPSWSRYRQSFQAD